MPKNYPPLTPSEVIKILEANGFTFTRQKGSHKYYTGYANNKKCVVTVDAGEKQFGKFLIQNMVRQSGLKRKAFYCSTKQTARKINERYISPGMGV